MDLGEGIGEGTTPDLRGPSGPTTIPTRCAPSSSRPASCTSAACSRTTRWPRCQPTWTPPRPATRTGDGRSWWARTGDGADRLVRMQGFDRSLRRRRRDRRRRPLSRASARLTGDGHRWRHRRTQPHRGAVQADRRRRGHLRRALAQGLLLGRHCYDCCSLTRRHLGHRRRRRPRASSASSPARIGRWCGRRPTRAPASISRSSTSPTETGDVTVHLSCTLHMAQPPVDRERRVLYTSFPSHRSIRRPLASPRPGWAGTASPRPSPSPNRPPPNPPPTPPQLPAPNRSRRENRQKVPVNTPRSEKDTRMTEFDGTQIDVTEFDGTEPYAGFGGRVGRTFAGSESWWPTPPDAARRRPQRDRDDGRRPRLRRPRLLRLRDRHPEPRPPRRRGPSLPQLPRDPDVLADAGRAAHRPQPARRRRRPRRPQRPRLPRLRHGDRPATRPPRPRSSATTATSRRWSASGTSPRTRTVPTPARSTRGPCQRGFDRFYGVLDAFTNLHHPHRLVEDNHTRRDRPVPRRLLLHRRPHRPGDLDDPRGRRRRTPSARSSATSPTARSTRRCTPRRPTSRSTAVATTPGGTCSAPSASSA